MENKIYEYDRIQKLKNKYGFEKSDAQIDMQKRGQLSKNIPKLILPDSCKPKAKERTKLEDDILNVLDVAGEDNKDVNVRRGGLSDELLKTIQEKHPEDDVEVSDKDLVKFLNKTPYYKYKFFIKYKNLLIVLGYVIMLSIILYLIF